MKIRLLIDARTPGGIETHVLNLCEGLAERNHDCMIIFVCDYTDNPLYLICNSHSISYKACRSYRELFNFLRHDKPDVIHAHGYKANILGRMIGLTCGIKVVTTFHSGEKPAGRLILYNFLDRWSSFLSLNIGVNSAIADSLPSRAQVIPNFVDMPDTPGQIKQTGPYNVYFVGRMNPEKGPMNFCQLSLMPTPDIKWHMVGAGPLLAACKEQYGNSVQFHGLVTDMEKIWPDADMLCITSIYEGLPLVMLEAMSRGIPVVSFDVGSVRDVLVDMTYVIKPFDISLMKSRIASHFMQSIDVRESISRHLRDKVISDFSSAVIIPKILALYAR